MTTKEFGQTIKQKYPQYKDISDEELGNKMLAKYPQYKDMVNSSSNSSQLLLSDNQPKQDKTLIEKVGDFTGLSALGKGVGLLAFKYLSPEGIELQKKVSNGTANKYELNAYANIFKDTPSAKELLSSAGQTAIALGTAGLSAPASLVGKVAQAGAISGGLGGLQAFGENKNTVDIAKQAGTSALVGGATMGGLSAIGSGIGKIVNKIPETTWSSILKRTPTSVAKNPNLEKQIANTGIIGTSRSSLSNKFGKEIQNIELGISEILNGKNGKISTKTVSDSLNSLKNTYSQIPGEQASVSAIEKIQNEMLSKGKSITVQSANDLKRGIYQVIQNSYGKGILEVPAKTESQKIIARSLKQEIEKVIPEIKSLNEKQAVFLQAKKAIDKTIARETGKGILGTGIGLYDILTGIGGGTVTGNPIVGLATIGAKKLGESPASLSTTSAGATKLINYYNNLSPTQKVMFYSGLRGLVTEGSK